MSVTRRGLRDLPEYDTLALKAGILAGATYPEQTIKDAQTGKERRDPRAGMAVATIAAALEYGVRQNRPRPFMQQTVARMKTTWVDNIVKLVRSGQPVRSALTTVGQTMKEDIQTTINDWPADNSDSWAAFKGFNKGLIQTSHLLNSVNYAIVENTEND